MPERVFNDRETPLCLIHRRGPDATDFFGVPRFGDQTLQALGDLLALHRVQVTMIQGRQLRGDGIVFLDQGAPRDFGRVRGEYQLDLQLAELPGECVR